MVRLPIAHTITGTVHDVLATRDPVVTLVNTTATRGGRTLAYRVAEIWHVRDGKIVERWALSDQTAAIAAFLAYVRPASVSRLGTEVEPG